ncbi:thermonuclease family protein [Pseudogemmobacter faecipullorum]|uniref:Thermonuclease family protein n=1 Tax=Pseudogemmobacter faecipullorum TaxID=2755041 RepID=A0ABS8CSR2_9RHOB|nr:thermonuclease family protein [Pseudogemmobacter faecipullorum]MCB5412185.1 thermonuclease family protein [Pseudogemmobacter faecipullorum]
MIKIITTALAFSLLSVLPSAARDSITGTASVIDGDTIEIHGKRIRLHGIDSPESRQRCYRNGKAWRCGTDAANALSELIGRKSVSCNVVDVDRYKRLVAVCSVQKTNINDWMVRNGWAMAYRRYSKAYNQAEKEAAKAGRGIWSSDFEAPWDWRRAN